MKNAFRNMALAATAGLCTVIGALPASAQIDLGIGVKPEINVGVDARVEERSSRPYTYDGYDSGYWHTRGDVRRDRAWDARYRGYDCYQAFQYTYEDGERVRYDSTFCYDDRDRPQEVRETRVVVTVR